MRFPVRVKGEAVEFVFWRTIDSNLQSAISRSARFCNASPARGQLRTNLRDHRRLDGLEAFPKNGRNCGGVDSALGGEDGKRLRG
jgi:hypothetical protein